MDGISVEPLALFIAGTGNCDSFGFYEPGEKQGC
jgi:hypothetical protein